MILKSKVVATYSIPEGIPPNGTMDVKTVRSRIKQRISSRGRHIALSAIAQIIFAVVSFS